MDNKNEVVNEAKQKMEQAVTCLQEQLLGVRGSGVSPSLVGSVKVESYGQPTPINNLACITKSKSNVSAKIFIEERGLINRVEKALQKAGLNAYLFDKKTVCIAIENHSQKDKVIAHVKKSSEEAKIAVRNVRKTYRKKYKDDLEEIGNSLQNVTDGAIERIDTFAESKINSL